MKRILILILVFAAFAYTGISQTIIDSMQDYTGQYVFPEGNVVPSVDVTLDNGKLSMHSVAGSSSLTRMGIDTFSIVEFSGLAVFRRDNNKIVNGVYIEAMGYVLEGKKKEGAAWSFSVLCSKPESAAKLP